MFGDHPPVGREAGGGAIAGAGGASDPPKVGAVAFATASPLEGPVAFGGGASIGISMLKTMDVRGSAPPCILFSAVGGLRAPPTTSWRAGSWLPGNGPFFSNFKGRTSARGGMLAADGAVWGGCEAVEL